MLTTIAVVVLVGGTAALRINARKKPLGHSVNMLAGACLVFIIGSALMRVANMPPVDPFLIVIGYGLGHGWRAFMRPQLRVPSNPPEESWLP